MDKKISVSLEREKWVVLAKFISKNIGRFNDILPAIELLEELRRGGISVAEMK